MCGIFGVFNFSTNAPVDVVSFKKASSLLSHRGPDGEGFFFDQNSGVGLGHMRLSIIDLSTGDQPMSNEDETIWLIFNGEIYNYQELRKLLISKGHTFKTKSDSEVIIHAYEEYGEACPGKLNGIFAFAIWDSKKRSLFLVRDHFGIKPLYYSMDKDRIIFSSELKAILFYSDIQRELDLKALNLCLSLRHTPSPFTLLKGIEKLPPTHYLMVNKERSVPRAYWDRAIKLDYSHTEDEWIEILKANFKEAVKRQMMSDVPIGISLSGGVDSTSILSLMSKYSTTDIHAFTVGFDGGKYKDNEIARAKRNADKYGVQFHSRMISSEDYSNFLDKYLWHLEEPLGNESAVAVYFIAEMAKGVVKVLLNGQGADEIFAGYNRHLWAHYTNKYNSLNKLIKLIPSFIIPSGKLNKFNALYDFTIQHHAVDKLAAAYNILSKEQKRNLFGSELYNSLNGFNDQNKIVDEIIKRIDGNILEKMLVTDSFTSLSENLLLVQDKLGMAAGIESRVPFLDVEYATTALSIPSQFKVKNRKGKYIHKKVCESFVSTDTVHQKKIGFQDPVDIWLRDSLGEYLMDKISSANSITNTYLDKHTVIRMFTEHKNKSLDHKRFLYLLLSIEKWADLFLNQKLTHERVPLHD